MRPLFQVSLLFLSGLGVLHASLFTDLYLRYVKEGMRPFLIASGAILLLLATAETVSYWRRGRGDEVGEADEDHDGDGHGHSHTSVPRVAWLLLLPALSLLFYAPPALGAYTAAREPSRAVKERDHFDPLPATSPVPLTLTEFTSRVRQDREQGIKDRSVLLTGFVTPGSKGDGWYLTRLILSCCAADAQSVKVRIHGARALPADTWVSVTGTWHSGGTLGTASAPVALDARTVTKVDRPVNAYTDALPLPTTR
ncbi:TIGR03943 family putative permease subunit [Streptomyces sp. NBC_00299]|uniref:TIGR03943 family putative permease subunit n=1 Tax=Streptomyces sp. NBC_00299 TaxID=2975705 RepID=UPI002E2D1424|nr:TIGR03943 family protein [Streptomyces sp. NBC_00299]